MSDFVHLHTHSWYSLLDGLSSPEQLVVTAKELGQTAMALTDHGALHGLVDFAKATKKHGIKPIYGVETYVAPAGRFEKKAKDWPSHLLLLARDDRGYKNLLKMISLAHLEGFYYRPRVDYELLERFGEGITATSACLGGEVLQALLHGHEDEAIALIERYQGFFGKENFFLEIQARPEIADARAAYPKLVELARRLSLPLVAANDIHYARADQREAHDVLLCVQTGKRVSDVDRMRLEGQYSVRSAEDMRTLLTESYDASVAEESMANTVKIAEACTVEISLGKTYFPDFPTPAGITPMQELRRVTIEGFEKRFGINLAAVDARAADPTREPADDTERDVFVKIDRLLYELGVIERMGFPTYFLIVWDFIRAAREMGVVVGPGRGSAAGSIVTYSLGITDLDPLKYQLLFERFLNPDRISNPDIDVDFADVRRADVLRYVEQKYGKDNVAQVCTFGTMKARAVIRDVGRVLDIPLPKVDQIAKLIPAKPGTKLKPVLETDHELRALAASDPEVRRLFELALQLEGCVRHVSTHACAVVIAPGPLTDYTPIMQATREDATIITQFAMGPIEEVGLVKMDFLGLRNLSILERALTVIKKVRGIDIDLKELPENDPATLRLLGEGKTTGVFQFESAGMRRYLRELKPTTIEDLIAMVALYRPGPMQSGYIDKFIHRKQGKEKITVEHPLMENALAPTYGVTVYQEQVMQISKDMAGFTGGQADTLRKGMGKKIAEVLAKMRVAFIDGSMGNGVPRETAEKVFTDFEHFAEYAFNKSHAACYALIAYQTAYLKEHFPVEFMAALLTTDMAASDFLDRLAIDLKECADLHIPVLPPSVSESISAFTVVDLPPAEEGAAPRKGIRFGLSAIKNLGENAVAAIVRARKAAGPFDTLEDFLTRTDADALNKKAIEALAKAGALEGLGERKALLASLDTLTAFAREAQGKAGAGQIDLFSLLGEQHQASIPHLMLASSEPASDFERLAMEKEVLGMFVSDHPLVAHGAVLEEAHMTIASISNADEGKQRLVAGIVTTTKRITTKAGDTMLFATAEDLTGSLEVVIFPRVFQSLQGKIPTDTPLLFTGKVSYKSGRGEMTDEPKMLLDSLEPLSPEVLKAAAAKARRQAARSAPAPAAPAPVQAPPLPDLSTAEEIRVPADLPRETLEELKRTLARHRGPTPTVVVFMRGDATVKRVVLPFGITHSATLQLEVETLVRRTGTAA